jgi:hypothetical protein
VGVTFGALDAFAFVVFAVLLTVVVVAIVSLGKLPGQLARKWNHPQSAAINVAGWIGVATCGLIWPLALIWAFLVPSASKSTTGNSQMHDTEAPATLVGHESQP